MIDEGDLVFLFPLKGKSGAVSDHGRATLAGGSTGDEVLTERRVRAVVVEHQRAAGVLVLNRRAERAVVIALWRGGPVVEHAAVIAAAENVRRTFHAGFGFVAGGTSKRRRLGAAIDGARVHRRDLHGIGLH